MHITVLYINSLIAWLINIAHSYFVFRCKYLPIASNPNKKLWEMMARPLITHAS